MQQNKVFISLIKVDVFKEAVGASLNFFYSYYKMNTKNQIWAVLAKVLKEERSCTI
jgi:hypothetical protein